MRNSLPHNGILKASVIDMWDVTGKLKGNNPNSFNGSRRFHVVSIIAVNPATFRPLVCLMSVDNILIRWGHIRDGALAQKKFIYIRGVRINVTPINSM